MMCIVISHYFVKVKGIFELSKEMLEIKQKFLMMLKLKHTSYSLKLMVGLRHHLQQL